MSKNNERYVAVINGKVVETFEFASEAFKSGYIRLDLLIDGDVVERYKWCNIKNKYTNDW